MFTRTLLHRTALLAIGWMNSRIQNTVSKMGRPSTIIADENIEAVERIVMRDLFVALLKNWPDHGQSTGHEEGLHTMGIEIVDINSTCRSCGLLLNPAKFFDCIVTGDESWIHHYDLLNQGVEEAR